MPLSEVISSMEAASIGEGRERGRGLIKCRIPQMTSQKRGRTPPIKSHGINFETLRPRSAASRYKDPSPHSPVHAAQGTWQTRSDKEKPALKRPSNLPKILLPPLRPPRTVIKIPMSTVSNPGNTTYVNPVFATRVKNEHDITDERTITNCEDQDIDMSSLCPNTEQGFGTNEEDAISISSNVNKKIQLKIHWQENIVKFENIKRQLHEQQRGLLELYATLRKSHEEMLGLGQKVYLPPPEDLTIMNVAKLSPDQLLQLCAGTLRSQQDSESPNANTTHPIDMNVLHEIPNKIVATCEETLDSRKGIIDWFEEVMTKKMITKTILVNKINQFKIETEQFRTSLETNKADYMRFIRDTSDIITQSASALLANQLHSENSASKLSEMHALNEDLKRKLRAAEQQIKYTANKPKVEELEKELKDEKYKKATIRDRLSRAEVQSKIKDEKITQLKAAWEEANSKILDLEKTVVQLREENQKLQSAYDIKMQNLNESINKNTKHLEEIMEDRSKLLTEKEDLEKRLSELSRYYEEALHDTKHESNSSVAKLIEVEKKYNEVTQDKNNLEHKVESLTAQLIESELRFKDLSKELSDVEYTATRDAAECRKEMENLKVHFNETNEQLLKYKKLAAEQTIAMKKLEDNWKNAIELEELLKTDLNCKEKLISELENQGVLLEQRLQESDSKTESYAAELSILKNHISQLQEDFGEFDSWEELHEMMKQQSKQLRETTQQNNLLSEALKKKEIELQQQIETITEQGHLLEERDAAVKMLTEKDEEQTNIIKLLRNNLEMKAQADVEFNQKIEEKNAEIESLIRNVNMRKQQISQLEKIILTLENQTLKLSNQKRKARDTIQALEKKLQEYETYFMTNPKTTHSTTDNLDELINRLEYELANPVEDQIEQNQEYEINSQTLVDRQSKQEKHHKFKFYPENGSSIFKTHENVPTKIVMGNYVKKTYLPNESKHKGDNLGRKKAITSIESSEWGAMPEIDVSATVPYPKKEKKPVPPLPARHLSRNIPYCLIPNYIGDEKMFKMFKFAGHRL